MNWKKFFKKEKTIFYTCVSSTPLAVWLAIHEGHLPAIVKEGKDYTEEDLRKAWYSLNDSYISIFGFDNKVKRLLKLRKSYALAMAKFLETGNRQHEMDAKILEVDIEKENQEATEGSSEKSSFTDLIAIVEKYYGFPIDTQQITVRKFYTYLKLMREERDRVEKIKTAKNG